MTTIIIKLPEHNVLIFSAIFTRQDFCENNIRQKAKKFKPRLSFCVKLQFFTRNAMPTLPTVML